MDIRKIPPSLRRQSSEATPDRREVAHKIPLTRDNLGDLYLGIGLVKAELVDVTGWTRGQIDYGIRRWGLARGAEQFMNTHVAIYNLVAKARGVRLSEKNAKAVMAIADAAVRRIRDQVLAGTFKWRTETGSDDFTRAFVTALLKEARRAA